MAAVSFDEDATVNSLIDVETNSWDREVLRALFNPNIVEEILRIRLPFNRVRDKMIWDKESSGNFTNDCRWTIFEDIQKDGVGVVLRDATGGVLRTATKREDVVDEAATIEALAILRGLQLCIPLGIRKLVIESDCLLLVQELQASSNSLANAGNIIADVKQLLSRFKEVQIQHVNRMGNSVAHALARNAWNVADISVWWDHLPSFLQNFLWLDANSCMDAD
ncbi:unnamed protein product [Fraxinus pennsylvanica]|uniref:RNase H type-1 domain-containing protein n=1 Tax=Fraxinus pennsylvanica TaxID=56036 RepID=A0AAD2ADY7_9LAMI|nr:unnamed protein product [Fraxinus pennsylvanica]